MNENVNVCITPKGDKPILHFSQFDNERVFTVTVLADDGESAAVLTGLDIELRLKKTDSHVVTIAPESVADNVITFKTTEQLCACCGQNIASVVLMDNEMIVSTLDILVDIQRDILSGGLTSESDIRNLTTQIEQIVPEVVGDDYYNKQEVDELLAEHTFDPTNYYDKSDVDGLLADKADSDDVYTKSDVDGLLADKADSDDVYTKSETDDLLSAKMDNIGYHGIVDDAAVISFTTDCNAPLDIIKGKIDPDPNGFSALNVTRKGVNLWNEQTRNGYYKLDGTFQSYSGNLATVNPIRVMPNTNYRLLVSGGTGAIGRVCWYDVNGTFISTQAPQSANIVLTSPANAYYLNFDLTGSYGTTYGNNVAVLYPSTQTTYSPYNGQTATVNFGQTVTIGGIVDLTNGKITLSDDTEITVTPVTVSSIVGVNNIFLDTGNLTEIAYFEGVDDNLNKLIKAYQI